LPTEAKEPRSEYALTVKHGPYMIYVASFRGEEAYDLAHALAQELVNDFRLQAYILHRTDKDAEAERQRIKELQGSSTADLPPSLRRSVRVFDEYAVLVGHYRDMEAARAGVEKLKKLPAPKSVNLSNVAIWRRNNVEAREAKQAEKAGFQQIFGMRKFEKTIEGESSVFLHAFPTINPLVSAQRRQEAINPFQEMNWMEINRKEQFSLLSCPQPLTLIVKEFHSKEAAKIRPKQNYDPLQKTKPKPESSFSMFKEKPKFAGFRGAFTFIPPIMDQADEALKFTKELRDAGFQAYVLHLEETSYVTVGGYSGLNDPNLKQTWNTLRTKYSKEPFLKNPAPTIMPVPGRKMPDLGKPVQ
jgi:hypothetical protein